MIYNFRVKQCQSLVLSLSDQPFMIVDEFTDRLVKESIVKKFILYIFVIPVHLIKVIR